ncbi:hypothetical protein HaLaN_04907, partial [Haematococcus lacustris]
MSLSESSGTGLGTVRVLLAIENMNVKPSQILGIVGFVCLHLPCTILHSCRFKTLRAALNHGREAGGLVVAFRKSTVWCGPANKSDKRYNLLVWQRSSSRIWSITRAGRAQLQHSKCGVGSPSDLWSSDSQGLEIHCRSQIYNVLRSLPLPAWKNMAWDDPGWMAIENGSSISLFRPSFRTIYQAFSLAATTPSCCRAACLYTAQ